MLSSPALRRDPGGILPGTMLSQEHIQVTAWGLSNSWLLPGLPGNSCDLELSTKTICHSRWQAGLQGLLLCTALP